MINWQVRYAKVLSLEKNLYDPDYSVLEIGPGDLGIANFLNRVVYGIQPSFGPNVHHNLIPNNGSVEALPFKSNSFDYTICMDVFEHLSSKTRPLAIKEIMRVTKTNAWIAFPFGLFSKLTEHSLHESFTRMHLQSPDWLLEHFENSLPEFEEILSILQEDTCELEILVNESISEHFNALLADLFLPKYKELLKLKSNKISNLNPFPIDDLDFPYSILIKISKIQPAIDNIHLSSGERPLKPEAGISVFSISHIFFNNFILNNTTNLIPLYVGDASDAARRGGLESDFVSDGVHLDNKRWCEMSGIYKVWKSSFKKSHVGFCHYRRIFNFSNIIETINPIEDYKSNKRSDIINGDLLHNFRDFISPNLELFGNCNSIIIPPAESLSNSNFIHYASSHIANDYLSVISFIFNKYPTFRKALINSTADNYIFSNNMFILPIKFFDNLCSFWFDVLFEFERRNTTPKYNHGTQCRDIAYLSERVFDVWIRKQILDGAAVTFVPIYNLGFDSIKTNEWSPTKFITN